MYNILPFVSSCLNHFTSTASRVEQSIKSALSKEKAYATLIHSCEIVIKLIQGDIQKYFEVSIKNRLHAGLLGQGLEVQSV